MKAFFRELVLIMCLVSGIVFGTQAQQVPGAIKYQAVLRDVNGKTLANKENVNLRISLRLDDPTTGQITYSEEHKGITTNAYGVINLEIGGGTVTSGKDLHEVPWAQHDIYVQIEIETDGTGYTHMGNAELLTVPYAFYAENAGTEKLYENLDNNVLPKYNAANKTLVNSGVSQQGRDLEVDASSITFINKADANMSGYKFPMTVGRRGQVLGFTDNAGTLDWVNVEGGPIGSVDLNLQGDGHLVYWNDTKGELDTVSALKYDYKGTRKLELNTDITGTNNVLVSDKLGDGQIWVGDNFSNRLTPVSMSGAVLMDKTGKTTLNLAMKGGIQLIPGQNGAIDTLAVDNAGSGEGGGSGSESLWETSEAADGYLRLFPKGDDTHDRDNVYVGIGHHNPTALFHVMGHASMLNPRALFSECDVEFASETNMATGYTPSVQWFKDKSSLFVGALSADKFMPSLGNYSFAFGADASAAPNHTFALGKEAGVAAGAADAFAIGNYSKAQGVGSMALGNGAEASGSKSIALGDHAVSSGNYSVVLGHTQYASSDAVLVGYDNGDKENNIIANAVVVGKGNMANLESIVLGSGNNVPSNSIVIGQGNSSGLLANSLVVGHVGQDQHIGPIVVGTTNIDGPVDRLVSIGNFNEYDNGNKHGSSYTNILGTYLSNGGTYPSLTMLGDNYNEGNTRTQNAWEEPVFMYGSLRIWEERSTNGAADRGAVAFEVSSMGNAFFTYDVNVEGDVLAKGSILEVSDERLKTDIKPMLWTPDFLDLITPVSYSFKSDKQQKTHFGFIAQEVRKVFPELVREDKKGMLSLDYIGLIPVLWQINQNLSHKIDDLEQRLEEQSRKQAELESELQAIKAKLGM